MSAVSKHKADQRGLLRRLRPLTERLASIAGRYRASLQNTAWALFDSLLRLLLGFAVSLWVARYLGPEQFGVLGLASAWVTLFGALSWLGIGDAFVRDLVKQTEQHAVLLGTALVLRLMGAIVACAICVGVLWCKEGRATPLVIVAGLLAAAAIVAEPSAVVYGWFQAKSHLRPAILSRSLGFIAGQLLRIGAILGGLSLLAFGVIGLIEAALASGALYVVYRQRADRVTAWRFSGTAARKLLADGLPLLLAASLAVLHLRIDQIMLGEMAGLREVGIYSAAARWSEVWWFVPVLIMRTFAPAALFAEQDDRAALHKMSFLCGALGWMAIGLATCVSLLVVPWVPVLLGPGYELAGIVLAIHIWSAIPVFIDAPAFQQLVRSGQQRPLMLRAAFGAALNVVLNLWLIPEHGAIGASVATLLAYALSGPLAYAQSAAGRQVLRAQWQGLLRLPLLALRLRRPPV